MTTDHILLLAAAIMGYAAFLIYLASARVRRATVRLEELMRTADRMAMDRARRMVERPEIPRATIHNEWSRYGRHR